MFKKPIFIYESRWLRWNPFTRWVWGQVLYPLVLFRFPKEEVDDRLFRHELEHFYQGQRLGFFRYYLKYLWLYFRHGYKNHPMEIEAREVHYNPLTEQERKWKDES